MEGVQPEQGTANQEVFYFMAAVVVDQGAPVLVPAPARVFVFVKGGAVKLCQGVFVVRKVSGNPVQNYPDIVLVALVNQVTKVVRAAVAAGGRVVAGGLVAPGFIQGMLGYRQQFNMREAALQYVWNQLLCQFPVTQPAPGALVAPGAGMHLVNGNGAALPVKPVTAFQPVAVFPAITPALGNPGGG